MKVIHEKIKQFKLRADVYGSTSYVDAEGNLQTGVDFKAGALPDSRVIKGYLSVWGVRDTYGTVFIKGCFAKSIQERGPQSGSKQKIAFCWQHDLCDPIGQFTKLEEDDYGLYFEAIADNVPNGDRALEQIASGTLNQFSHGFLHVWDKMEYDETMDAILIYEANLKEGSVVTLGSNHETYAMRSVEQLQQDKENLLAETEALLKEIPIAKRLEVRQLIDKHVSLTKAVKPQLEKEALNTRKPEQGEIQVGDYKLNLTKF